MYYVPYDSYTTMYYTTPVYGVQVSCTTRYLYSFLST